MKTVIPLIFAFDNNFVIPAAVAFYSLLDNCNRNYHYIFHILHSDISIDNQNLLQKTIEEFSGFSSLNFIDMRNQFDDLWQHIDTKAHFTKEVMYKIILPSVFPQYEKVIVSDVDVVYLNDISNSFFLLNLEKNVYLAGVKPVGKILSYYENYMGIFTNDEIKKLSCFCGGYLVMNLRKIREDKMEEKFISCFQKEGHRIKQMEQDVLNMCCYPNIEYLPLNYVTPSYIWDLYTNPNDFENDNNYSKAEIIDAITNPIQLHYAGKTKPWNQINCTKSEEWYKYLVKTPFFTEQLKLLVKKEYIYVRPKNKELNFFQKVIDYIHKDPFFLFHKSFYLRVCQLGSEFFRRL
jgi:lipopolysaccharide biosynthesis glycosyltransferase